MNCNLLCKQSLTPQFHTTLKLLLLQIANVRTTCCCPPITVIWATMWKIVCALSICLSIRLKKYLISFCDATISSLSPHIINIHIVLLCDFFLHHRAPYAVRNCNLIRFVGNFYDIFSAIHVGKDWVEEKKSFNVGIQNKTCYSRVWLSFSY